MNNFVLGKSTCLYKVTARQSKKNLIKMFFRGEISLSETMEKCGYRVVDDLLSDAKALAISIPFNAAEINRLMTSSFCGYNKISIR